MSEARIDEFPREELSPSSGPPTEGYDLFQGSVRSLAQGLAYESLHAAIGEAALAYYYRRSISGRSAAPISSSSRPTSQPTEMSSRNWMMRRMLIDAIRNDPDWNNGNYTIQPRSLRVANVFYNIATSGGTLAYQQMAPTDQPPVAQKEISEV